MFSSFRQERQNSQGYRLNLKEKEHFAVEREVILHSSQRRILLLPFRQVVQCPACYLPLTASVKCITPTPYGSPAVVFKPT